MSCAVRKFSSAERCACHWLCALVSQSAHAPPPAAELNLRMAENTGGRSLGHNSVSDAVVAHGPVADAIGAEEEEED